jgi:3-oxoacyl-[acyl-carrier protein] reductase
MGEGRQSVAFVTGGNGGIGRAINRRLVDDGMVVVSADIAIDPSRNGRCDTDQGERVYVHHLDVTSTPSVRCAVEWAVGLGELRAVVNCAGILRATPLGDIGEEAAKQMLDTNLFGTARVTDVAAPHLKPGAAIVNISSVACRVPEIGYISLYGASKAGIESFTRSTAKDLGPRGVRVNSIAPGIIDVDMSADMRRVFDDPESPMRRVCLKRMGRADEVADAVAYLLSDRASYVSGTNLLVDGGLAGY